MPQSKLNNKSKMNNKIKKISTKKYKQIKMDITQRLQYDAAEQVVFITFWFIYLLRWCCLKMGGGGSGVKLSTLNGKKKGLS